jgi:PadR family transcriptional regulator, regulatory protein PadR
MGNSPRMTLQTQMVLSVFLRDVRREQYGLEIAREAGLPSGTIYPILSRLEVAGWLESGWEEIDEAAVGRRRRRYYKLTGEAIPTALRAIEGTKRFLFPDPTGAPS